MGDDGYHGGAFMLSANFGFYAFFHPQKNPMTPSPTIRFDFGTPDHYRFYLRGGQYRQSGQAVSEGLELAVQRPVQARHLRRLLEGARPVAAHEERALRGAGGGRLV